MFTHMNCINKLLSTYQLAGRVRRPDDLFGLEAPIESAGPSVLLWVRCFWPRLSFH